MAGELWIGLAVVALAVLAGWAAASAMTGVALAAVLYLAWHLFQLWRFNRFADTGSDPAPRLPLGLWQSAFGHLRRLQRSDRKRRKRRGRFFTRFRQAVSALPDALVVLSRHGEIDWCNRNARHLLGLEWPSVAGKRIIEEVRHPLLEEYLERGEFTRPLEIESPSNPSVMLSVHVVRFRKKKQQYLLLARDITDIYNLDRSQRDFIANASHELRTPLTVIRGYLETLENSAGHTGPEAMALQSMARQAGRMQGIIDDLMALSRLEMAGIATTGEAVDMARLLEQVVDEARVIAADSGHEIRLQADPDLWLDGDSDNLHSAASNLVINAIRHTPPRCRVWVRWGEADGGGLLEVEDDGEGIPARHLSRITERFYRVDTGRSRESGGTGLGLSIVRRIVERHEGELTIHSEVGIGSRFSCRFPAHRLLRGGAPDDQPSR